MQIHLEGEAALNSTFLHEPSSKRHKGFPSEASVKRVYALYKGTRNCPRSSAGMTFTHAARGRGFRKCCMRSGRYDNAARDHYNR